MSTALVVYESEYGNTKRIAEAIRNGIADATGGNGSCRMVHVRDVITEELSTVDLLVIGCPTQKFTMMPSTKRLIRSLPKDALHGVHVAAFDTRITKEEFAENGRIFAFLPAVFGYAAEPLAKRLVKHGGIEIASPVGFFVHGTEGPLLEGETERAAQWGGTLVEALQVTSA